MEPKAARDSDSGLLALLMDAAASDDSPWQADDLAGVLRHQLRAALAPDLSPQNLEKQAAIQGLAGAAEPPIATFADLLHHPNPPVELLQHCRDFAKRHGLKANGPLPPDAARVIYYMAILVARRHGLKISRLSDADLQTGAEWVASRKWVDPHTRGLAQTAGETESGSP